MTQELTRKHAARSAGARSLASNPPWHCLVRRYGLDGQNEATLAELSRELGISRERVR